MINSTKIWITQLPLLAIKIKTMEKYFQDRSRQIKLFSDILMSNKVSKRVVKCAQGVNVIGLTLGKQTSIFFRDVI